MFNPYLKLNLQFFADNDTSSGTDNAHNQDINNGNQSSDGTQNTENMIPYSRFKEVNDNYKSVKAQLDELLKKQEEAELEAKKKVGEYEELYNNLQKEHEPLKEKLKKYQAVVNNMLDVKLKQVPEEYHDLIPEDLDELAKLAWIDNAIAKGLFQKQPQSFGNKGNNPVNQTELTKEDFAKMTYRERVKLANENPELYRKLSR